MKIVTWNIYKKNKDLRKAVAFLKKQNADIICLQEFPIDHINLLSELGGNITVCDEVLVFKSRRRSMVRLYSVIISKFPVKERTLIPHQNTYDHTGKTKNKYKHFKADSFYVDIDTDQGLFRIFNAHFKCVAGPHHRLSQFKEVIEHKSPDRHNIICGDFNTFGKLWLNLILWKLFGFKIQEVGINENKNLAVLFREYGLKNAFHRQVTFWKFPVQLDYILLPEGLEVKSKRTFLRPYGSDHFPLMVEI